ncbi:hypothetical protein [Bartonella sp. TS25HLJMH]|uniref:hypothetical protein n=1 Tax=Bartonella sp. TS25HLJMH TaxID=3243576 RepID=UPI0035CED323
MIKKYRYWDRFHCHCFACMYYVHMNGIRSFIFQANIDRILRFVEHRKSLCYRWTL